MLNLYNKCIISYLKYFTINTNIDSKSVCKKECETAAGFQMIHAGERERREEEVFFLLHSKKP